MFQKAYEEKPGSTGAKSGMNWQAVYTGEVLAEPLGFNLNKDQIIKAKNLNEKQAGYVNETEFVTDKNTKVVLTLRFNPFSPNNPYMELERTEGDAVPRTMYVDKTFYLTSKIVSNGDGSKVLVSDGRLGKVWIPYTEGKTAEELLLACQTTAKAYPALTNMDPKTSFFVREGHYELLTTLFNMTSLRPFYIGKDGVIADDCSQDFVVNDAFNLLEILETVVKTGNCRDLNELFINNPETMMCTRYMRGTENHQLPLGVMLGARISDSGNTYQACISNGNEISTYKISSNSRALRIPGYTALKSRLSGNFIDSLYGWDSKKNDFNPKFATKLQFDGFTFKEFQYTPVEKSVTTTVTMPKEPVAEVATGADDDLPF